MRILICDDHKIVREGLIQILHQINDVTVDEAQNGEEALKAVKNTIYDVVLMDISLPDRNGLEVLSIIKERRPFINVLMLSMLPQEQYAKRALKLGASGYLTKDTASDELIIAITRISKGGKYISQSLAENLADSLGENNIESLHEKLSDREFDVMLKIARGNSLMDIGNDLCISIKTVSTYRTRILEKMKMSKNADITMYCIKNELI
jgi:DNA-binding NarL/FixJ family response regulator